MEPATYRPLPAIESAVAWSSVALPNCLSHDRPRRPGELADHRVEPAGRRLVQERPRGPPREIHPLGARDDRRDRVGVRRRRAGSSRPADRADRTPRRTRPGPRRCRRRPSVVPARNTWPWRRRDREAPVLAVPAEDPRPALETVGVEPHHERVGRPVEPLPIRAARASCRRGGSHPRWPRPRRASSSRCVPNCSQPHQPAVGVEPGDERVGPASRVLLGEPPVGRTRDVHVGPPDRDRERLIGPVRAELPGPQLVAVRVVPGEERVVAVVVRAVRRARSS